MNWYKASTRSLVLYKPPPPPPVSSNSTPLWMGKCSGDLRKKFKKKTKNAVCLSFWTFYNWNWTSTALPSLKFNTTNYIYEFHFYKQKLNILIDTSLPSKTHSTSHHGWQSNHISNNSHLIPIPIQNQKFILKNPNPNPIPNPWLLIMLLLFHLEAHNQIGPQAKTM